MLQFRDDQTRRLPIYLLADCSGSMAGEPIEAVRQGLVLLDRTLKDTPQALETAWISVITFADSARQVVPLTEVGQFTPPVVSANGSTALGAALRTVSEAIDGEVVANSPERKGDYKPLVFIFTDGQPTDNWQDAAQQMKSRSDRKLANVIALGCGTNVDVPTLRCITDTVLLMEDITPENIRQFFQWVSQSVRAVSIRANQAGDLDAQTSLPPLPAAIRIAL